MKKIVFYSLLFCLSSGLMALEKNSIEEISVALDEHQRVISGVDYIQGHKNPNKTKFISIWVYKNGKRQYGEQFPVCQLEKQDADDEKEIWRQYDNGLCRRYTCKQVDTLDGKKVSFKEALDYVLKTYEPIN